MEIKIVIETNAMGCVTGNVFRTELGEEPMLINSLFPPHYQPYIKPIILRMTPEGLKMDSEYKNKPMRHMAPDTIYIPEIGLSYAVCSIEITEDRDPKSWSEL